MMIDILKTIKNENDVLLWWLGQSGFLLNIPGSNQLIAIDPYLSNSAGKIKEGLIRQVPIPIAPEDLDCDFYCCTHDHLDHLDPETINALKNKERITFIGPRSCTTHFLKLGIKKDRIIQLDVGQSYATNDFSIRATFCIPNEEGVLDSVGFLISFSNGKTIYHSGDTGYHSILNYIGNYTPDMALLCINGKFGNMNSGEAYELFKAIKAKAAIPIHFDMFPMNSSDPQQFLDLFNDGKNKCSIPKIGRPIKLP